MRPSLELAAAVAANGVIGRDGQLPWHLPDDLRHFKALTLDHAVIMGRRTWASMGTPLPRRRNIVVSRQYAQAPDPGVELVRSLDEALALTADSAGPVFIVGGAGLYAEALPRADVLHLTEIDAAVEGDVYFPELDRSAWVLQEATPHACDARHAFSFRFCVYRRAHPQNR
ncbi:MAG TPA: dihydrofolate reductase [Phycisphaerae bacterium]|nr:dihydrofolate reductase [Phycisphaerales bacterium]HRX83725.1 dihydrofolate reductase [Phycisphaerae bacterium]